MNAKDRAAQIAAETGVEIVLCDGLSDRGLSLPKRGVVFINADADEASWEWVASAAQKCAEVRAKREESEKRQAQRLRAEEAAADARALERLVERGVVSAEVAIQAQGDGQ